MYYIKKLIIKGREKLVTRWLKYPYSTYEHAKGFLWPDTTMCIGCLPEEGICVMSSPISPVWWIKYFGVKNIEIAKKKGVDNFEIYSINPEGKIEGKDICNILGKKSIRYSEVSPKEFAELSEQELYHELESKK